MDEIRGSPLAIGTLEEIIDDKHGPFPHCFYLIYLIFRITYHLAIVSGSNGPEYYVPILSFVDKDLLEPNATILMHNKNHAIVGLLQDDTDPMVSVMKVDKAPLETYADIGGLDKQIQEMYPLIDHYIDLLVRKRLSSP